MSNLGNTEMVSKLLIKARLIQLTIRGSKEISLMEVSLYIDLRYNQRISLFLWIKLGNQHT